jgi:hypothetical protein
MPIEATIGYAGRMLTTHRPHGPLSDEDAAYVRAGFVSLARLCAFHELAPALAAEAIRAGRLPRPSYLMDDGTAMFPRDAFEVPSAEEFAARFVAAGGEGDPAAERDGLLSGEYGVCLRQVTPETIAVKERLVATLERALADARPDDDGWRRGLRAGVAALDAITRRFAACDRVRFGGPVSRDRLIAAPRARWSWL